MDLITPITGTLLLMLGVIIIYGLNGVGSRCDSSLVGTTNKLPENVIRGLSLLLGAT